MRNILNVKNGRELAYINGNVLFDDCIEIIKKYMSPNTFELLQISSDPIDGHIKATKVGNIGNTTQFKSKDGIFTICNTFVNKYGLGKQFYYKVNKT